MTYAGAGHSVIVPTRNNPQKLERCLQHLCEAEPPPWEWEALVIDNSDPHLRPWNAAVVRDCGNARIRHCPTEGIGLMVARHFGAEMANGAVLSFLDDDSLVSSTWFVGVHDAFAREGAVLATGPILPLYETEPPDWVRHFWSESAEGLTLGYLSLLDFGAERKTIDPIYVWGCNYSVDKGVFMGVGGSHPDYLPSPWDAYQGDGEVGLSVRIAAQGDHAVYDPLCAIEHLVPEARLQVEYWRRRSYFVGLHCSFTATRRAHGLGPAQGVASEPSSERTSLGGRVRQAASRGLLGSVKRRLWPSRQEGSPTEAMRLRRELEERFEAGRQFHALRVAQDPVLREWVLRDDYLGERGHLPRAFPSEGDDC